MEPCDILKMKCLPTMLMTVSSSTACSERCDLQRKLRKRRLRETMRICGASHECARANKRMEMTYGNTYMTCATWISKALYSFISCLFAYKHGARICAELKDTADWSNISTRS